MTKFKAHKLWYCPCWLRKRTTALIVKNIIAQMVVYFRDDYLLCFGDPQRIPRSGKKQLWFHHIFQNLSDPFNIYSISKFSICSPSGLPALVATISLESQEKRGILKLGASIFQIRWKKDYDYP
ncbi:uncharacterized protein LOC122297658 isoform X7 [Carya illinoinensis]|uniref:uncharacterized protein LOC122297658 isoform X7 n=1 Tax=Carya illinoinensis TaxID=32201 RepID=UPI001C723DEE|nr:uncharacterized protein LOC122297658 isoform X7 [Carya illinoinensis]